LVKDLPADKELAAGIMDARNTKMETVDELVETIRAVSRHVSLDRLYVNPSAGLEFLPRATAQAKLARLVEGAQKAQEVLA
jgi:5-methyltetrahydropteroyltriglutamate--homocysteine methyltransferase